MTRLLLTVEAPLAGLEIGERLRWYAQRRPSRQVALWGAA
jgi:hypothetical protein